MYVLDEEFRNWVNEFEVKKISEIHNFRRSHTIDPWDLSGRIAWISRLSFPRVQSSYLPDIVVASAIPLH